MGKVDLFSILIDRPEGIYLAGEVVTGNLVINIKERLKINCVKMVLYGFARVHWTETYASGENQITEVYSSYEEYLNFNMTFESKKDGNDLYLEVGNHSYPFSIQLPDSIPTSFEHMHGRVRYSLNGTIVIPWAFDKHVQRSLTVISHNDLNLNPALRQPYNVSQTKVICCCCCKSDPIIATLSIPKGGFVPGERIVFNAAVDNKSSNDMKSVTAKLVQYVTLHSTRKSRTWTRVLAEVSAPEVAKERTRKDWNNGLIVVPPVCASSNKKCRIITVTYSLVLNVNPSGASLSFNAAIPIVIGTIPLAQFSTPATPPPSYQNYQKSNLEAPGHQNLEIEAKGEVIKMDQNWAPSYPYYKDFSIP